MYTILQVWMLEFSDLKLSGKKTTSWPRPNWRNYKMTLTMRHILITDIISVLLDITIMSIMLPWVKREVQAGTRDTYRCWWKQRARNQLSSKRIWDPVTFSTKQLLLVAPKCLPILRQRTMVRREVCLCFLKWKYKRRWKRRICRPQECSQADKY